MSNTHFRVFGDRVIVRPHKNEKKTASGLIVAGSARTDFKVGTVISVAATRIEYGVTIQNEVKIGDVVFYDTSNRINDDTELLTISNILLIDEGGTHE